VTAETRSLHRKLATIMYEAERIPKNGIAPQAMGGYRFVQVGDAADYIRKALAEKVITMMPTSVRVINQTDRPTKAGGTMTTVDLVVDWTLTDGESGESIVIQSFGAGADGGDKYSGKASTSAMKYALLSGFLLSTGEDSEGDGPEAGRPAAAAPAHATATQAPATVPSGPTTRPAQHPLPDESHEFDFRTTQQISPPQRQAPDEPPFPGSPGPARSATGGYSEGGVHTDGHNRLRARQSGALYCPTKMPDGSWCSWRP
jgi:ERF superfamily